MAAASEVCKNSICSISEYEHIIWFLVGRYLIIQLCALSFCNLDRELQFEDWRTLRLVARNLRHYLKALLNFGPSLCWNEINEIEQRLISYYQIVVTDFFADKTDPLFITLDYLHLKENNTFTMQVQVIVQNRYS
jgi:hypothetical protein